MTDVSTYVERIRIIPSEMFFLDNNEAKEKIKEWGRTDQGKFLIENAKKITYNDYLEFESYAIVVEILVKIESKKLSEFYLRFK